MLSNSNQRVTFASEEKIKKTLNFNLHLAIKIISKIKIEERCLK